MVYNEKGQEISSISKRYSSGEITSDEYTYRNDLITSRKIVYPDGSVHYTEYIYNDSNKLIQETDIEPMNGSTRKSVKNYKYDENQNMVMEFYFDFNLTSDTNYRLYAYDENNLIKSITFGKNINGTTSKEYKYNNEDKLLEIIELESYGSFVKTSYHYKYDNVTGKKAEELKIDGNIKYLTKYEYNSNGYLIKLSEYASSKTDSFQLFNTIEYIYDSENKLIKSSHNDYFMILMYQKFLLKDSTNSLPKKSNKFDVITNILDYKYDLNNNLIGEYVNNDLNNTYMVDNHEYMYNIKNQLIEEIIFRKNSNDIYRVINYEYDELGNVKVKTESSGKNKNSLISRTKYTYDSENKLLEEKSYNIYGKADLHLKYIYNSKGDILKVVTYKTNESFMRYEYEFY